MSIIIDDNLMMIQIIQLYLLSSALMAAARRQHPAHQTGPL